MPPVELIVCPDFESLAWFPLCRKYDHVNNSSSNLNKDVNIFNYFLVFIFGGKVVMCREVNLQITLKMSVS